MFCHAFCDISLSFQLLSETKCPRQYWISVLYYLPLLGTSSVSFLFKCNKTQSPVLMPSLPHSWKSLAGLSHAHHRFSPKALFSVETQYLVLSSRVFFYTEERFLLLLVENSRKVCSPKNVIPFFSSRCPHFPLPTSHRSIVPAFLRNRISPPKFCNKKPWKSSHVFTCL